MKTWISNFFYFSRAQRRGLYLLLGLLCIVLGIKVWLVFSFQPQPLKVVHEEVLLTADTIQTLAAQAEGKPSISNQASKAIKYTFNPNHSVAADWEQFNLSSKQIHVITRYLQAGGFFKTPDDINRLYCLSKGKAAEIKPYLVISTPQFNKEASRAAHPAIKQKTELNAADSAALEALPGIGPAIAKRIVGYRKLVGGFVSLTQLKEVYGVSDSLLNVVLPKLELNPALRSPILINKADEKELARHPYIKWKAAKLLVNYRQQHGKYNNLDDLRLSKALAEDAIGKLTPYLEFESSSN